MKTCRTRLGSGAPIPVIPHRTPGKKRKACDRCMKLKRACDAGLPCSTCSTKQKECFYTIAKEKKKPALESIHQYTTPPDEYANTSSDLPCSDFGLTSPSTRLDGIDHPLSPPCCEMIQDWPELALCPAAVSWPCELMSIPSQSNIPTCSKFEFLARITGSTGLTESFNCQIVSQRVQFNRSEPRESQCFSSGSSYGFQEDPFALNRSDDLEPTSLAWNLQMVYQKTQYPRDPSDGTFDPFHQWAIHPLASKTEEIVTTIKETIRHKPRRSAVKLEWSLLVEKMCYHFFSPPNLCRYLEAFWVSWYPNCPIIHKPSFNPMEASPILLAPMAIIGSCVLPSKQDNQNAEIWFNAVEEMVFDDESVQEEYLDAHVNKDASGKAPRLEALQGALFVCLFQNWEGLEITKRRIRRRRYSTVVGVSPRTHWDHADSKLTA